MNLGTYDIAIDFKNMYSYESTSIYFKEGDLNTAKVRAKLKIDKKTIDLTGCSIAVKIENTDENNITDSATIINAELGICEIDFKSNALSEGMHFFELIITKEGSVKKSPKVGYRVLDSIDDTESVEGANEYPILIQLINDTTKAIENATEALNRANEMQTDIEEAINNTNVAISNAEKATSDANSKINEVEITKTSMVEKVNSSIATMKADVEIAKNEMEVTTAETIADINRAIAAGTQDLEVKEARKDANGVVHDTLKERLESDLVKGKLIEETKEGNYLTFSDTVGGLVSYLEVFGNTVQDVSRLQDIRSVGIDNGDGTYKMSILSVGKNLFDKTLNDYLDGEKFGETKKVIFKVKPNTQYTCSTNCPKPTGTSMVFFNGGDSNSSGVWLNQPRTFTSNDNGNLFIAIRNTGYTDSSTLEDFFNGKYYIQLEEGTQATPFTPYEETRCDINLPCQLEKVGDTADRLYFDKEENAWCVDDNILTLNAENDTFISTSTHGDYSLYRIDDFAKKYNVRANGDYVITTVCNIFKSYEAVGGANFLQEGISLHSNGNLYIKILTSKTIGPRELSIFLKDNNFFVKCIANKPNKIVLPRDTQIKLNSFANKTHIYTISGEVDATVKATVSKSLASTVQANSNELNILSGRVADIEGLKESQDFSYETDKGYLVCKDTKPGVVKDMKLYGKSLVNINLAENIKGPLRDVDNPYIEGLRNNGSNTSEPIIIGEIYTFIVRLIKCPPNADVVINQFGTWADIYFDAHTFNSSLGTYVFKSKAKQVDDTHSKYWISYGLKGNHNGAEFEVETIILKGDYTQNPPTESFRGIASVGTGADKIEVSSYNTIILNEKAVDEDWGTGSIEGGTTGQRYNSTKAVNIEGVKFLYPYTIYNNEILSCKFISFYDKNGEIVGDRINNYYNSSLHFKVEVPNNAVYIRLMSDTGIGEYVNTGYIASIKPISNISEIVDIKSDKKPLLYKADDGTWKPIEELRGIDLNRCDTVEKHSDGKHYYHRRTKTTTLDETREWVKYNAEDNGFFSIVTDIPDLKNELNSGCVNNRLKVLDSYRELYFGRSDGIYCGNRNSTYGSVVIGFNKDNVDTIDKAKIWLQDNNITLVYPLAQEEVYEVAPIDLESYEDETMISFGSGVIAPYAEWKMTSYLPNFVKNIYDRVTRIENDYFKSVTIMFKSILNGNLDQLAYMLYPQDFDKNNDYGIMTIPELEKSIN